MKQVLICFLVFLCYFKATKADWPCKEELDCFGLDGGSCVAEQCTCPEGSLMSSDKAACLPLAPYAMSPCEDTAQCYRMITGYTCDTISKSCRCNKGFHYSKGRCWKSVDFGEACSLDLQCSLPQLPQSIHCKDGRCVCKDGYYERQRGDCRKIASNIDDECVVTDDCKIPNAICSSVTMTCVDKNSPTTTTKKNTDSKSTPKKNSGSRYLAFGSIFEENVPKDTVRVLENDPCNTNSDCSDLANSVCSNEKKCVCNPGFYPDEKKDKCIVELGVNTTDKSLCGGSFADIIDGVCDCPGRFFYSPYNRHCWKQTRKLGDACLGDESCYTFGPAARCSEPDKNGVRKCYCDTTISIQDEEKQICKNTNKVIGDNCESDDDCPGNVECINLKCDCKPSFIPNITVCLPTELGIGEPCYLDNQCAGDDVKCYDGFCSCDEGFFLVDGVCVKGLGALCKETEECAELVDNSECIALEAEGEKRCRCKDDFIPENNICYENKTDTDKTCKINAQCWPTFGDNSTVGCFNGTCSCFDDSHLRDEKCWKKTGLNMACLRTSQCYIEKEVNRTECRNSVCQCLYNYNSQYDPDHCSGVGSPPVINMAILLQVILIIPILLNFN